MVSLQSLSSIAFWLTSCLSIVRAASATVVTGAGVWYLLSNDPTGGHGHGHGHDTEESDEHEETPKDGANGGQTYFIATQRYE